MTQTPTDPAGILSAQNIKAEVKQNRLITGACEGNIAACSYDLRIGTIFREGKIINGSHPEAAERVIVESGEIVTILTEEELELPKNVAATAFAMNRMSSEGFLILNPGHVDPGFVGPLTIKAVNMRKVPLSISLGTAIFTVIFERMPEETEQSFNDNEPRDQREEKYSQQSIQTDAKSITDLVDAKSITDLLVRQRDAPFPDRQETREMIRSHWMSRLTLILTFIAALGGVIAAIAAIVTPGG